MKILAFILSVIALSTISLLTYGHSVYEKTQPPVVDTISTLEQQLTEIFHAGEAKKLDRNSALRLQRAIQYLRQAKMHQNANWNNMAIKQAKRGIALVALFQQNKVTAIKV